MIATPRTTTNRWQIFAVFALAALLFCGCKTFPGKISAPHKSGETNSAPRKVVKNIPRHHPTPLQKFNPLFWIGNVDDPVPPEWYRPENRARNMLWGFRNPMHNFFFYVVGIADKEFEVVGRFPGKVSGPEGGWNWTVCKYKCLRLPFVSYKRGNFNFYLGWRNRGNFGVKLNYSRKQLRRERDPVPSRTNAIHRSTAPEANPPHC
ncbi:MAG: hypothetical protein ABI042_00580 [Verrucomicrobiota bacterium]